MRLRWRNVDYHKLAFIKDNERYHKSLLPEVNLSAMERCSTTQGEGWIFTWLRDALNSEEKVGLEEGMGTFLMPTEQSTEAAEKLVALLVPQSIELCKEIFTKDMEKHANSTHLLDPSNFQDSTGSIALLETVKFINEAECKKCPYMTFDSIHSTYCYRYQEEISDWTRSKEQLGLIPNRIEFGELLNLPPVTWKDVFQPSSQLEYSKEASVDVQSSLLSRLQYLEPHQVYEAAEVWLQRSRAIYNPVSSVELLDSQDLLPLRVSAVCETSFGLIDNYEIVFQRTFFERPVEQRNLLSKNLGNADEEPLEDALAEPIPSFPTFEPPSFLPLTSGHCIVSLTQHYLNSSLGKSVKIENIDIFPVSTSFEALIVMPELTPDCYSFRCLPVPVFQSQAPEKTVGCLSFDSLAAQSTSLQLAARDRLYLDWHLCQGHGSCHKNSCWSLKKKQEETESLTGNNLQVTTASIHLPGIEELLESDQLGDRCRTANPVSFPLSSSTSSEAKLDPAALQRSPWPCKGAAVGKMPPAFTEAQRTQRRSSLQGLVPSMSNELSFFMKARNGASQAALERQSEGHEILVTESQSNKGQAIPISSVRDMSGLMLKPTKPVEHQVIVTSSLAEILQIIKADYEKVLRHSNTETDRHLTVSFGLDSEGNSQLQSLINQATSSLPTSQGFLRGLICLYVIRQTAVKCCHYGIRVSHLYLEHSLQGMTFMEPAVLKTREALQIAYMRVESTSMEDHPKLSILDNLLKTALDKQKTDKLKLGRILIVCDRKAFFVMYKQLVALGLKPFQVDKEEEFLEGGSLKESESKKLNQAVLDALTFSTCLLIPPAYITDSFPVDKFSLIVVFTADCLMVAPALQAAANVHVLVMTEWPTNSLLLPSSPLQEEASKCAFPGRTPPPIHLQSNGQILDDQNPVGRAQEWTWEEKNQSQGFHLPAASQPKKFKLGKEEPCMTVVANMYPPQAPIVSRQRQLYQRVLQLEKEGIQIVERDIDLPLDFVLSASACLILYNFGKLGLDEARFQRDPAPFCSAAIEHIIDNHMKPISLAYQECTMIFEGPKSFTSGVLSTVDDLYAVAAGLDIVLRCFMSESAQDTINLIVSSIRTVRNSLADALPPMQEAETEVEVLLNAYSALNPLSTHAILACGIPVPDFLSLTLEHQEAMTAKFRVSRRSLQLFKHQCLRQDVPQENSVEVERSAVPFCGMIDSANTSKLNSGERLVPPLRCMPPSSQSTCEENIVKSRRSMAGQRRLSGNWQSSQSGKFCQQSDPLNDGSAPGLPTERAWRLSSQYPHVARSTSQVYTNATSGGSHQQTYVHGGGKELAPESSVAYSKFEALQDCGMPHPHGQPHAVDNFEALDPALYVSGSSPSESKNADLPYFPPAADVVGELEGNAEQQPERDAHSPSRYPSAAELDGEAEEGSWELEFPMQGSAAVLPEDGLDGNTDEVPDFANLQPNLESPPQGKGRWIGSEGGSSVLGALDRWLATRKVDVRNMDDFHGEQPASPTDWHPSATEVKAFSSLSAKGKSRADAKRPSPPFEPLSSPSPDFNGNHLGKKLRVSCSGRPVDIFTPLGLPKRKRVSGPGNPGRWPGKKRKLSSKISDDSTSTSFDHFRHGSTTNFTTPRQQGFKQAAEKLLGDPLMCWTPHDKRAKEILTFEKPSGKGKQSKLVWRAATSGTAMRARRDPNFTV